MPPSRPRTFRGVPIDYRSRTERDNAAWEEYCQAVFPGVSRDVIVRPRYHARTFPLPAESTDLSAIASYSRHWLFNSCLLLSAAGAFGGGPNPMLRLNARNRLSRALRWWDSLDSLTPLSLNQSLYVRRDKWKNVEDVPELAICYALCVQCLSTPRNLRSSVEAKKSVRRTLRDVISAYEQGLKVNVFGELEALSEGEHCLIAQRRLDLE